MKKLFSILFATVLAVSLVLVPAVVSADSYSTDMGKACWSVPVDFTDETGLNWDLLEVEVTYADGKATFVITPPVAFNPEAWPNDNFWLVFDTDNDGVEDFQVGYNTCEPGTEMGGWPEHPTEHWFYKFDGSWYQLIPDDWDVSATSGLDQFTVSIPVSCLGGVNSNYGFQIGLVKWVHEDDWLAELPPQEFDPICEGWSTSALIFVPLPSKGWESETIPANTTVGLTGETPEITAISVTPTCIDFGTIYPGNTVSGDPIAVENIGTVTVVVDAWLDPLTGTVFNYLRLGGVPSAGYSGEWADYIISGLLPSKNKVFTTELVVPSTYSAGGAETATLIFEATGP